MKKSMKILIVISIIILICGLTSYFSITSELGTTLNSSNVNIDGTDMTGIVKVLGTFSIRIIGLMFAFGSIGIIIVIWIVYLIITSIRNHKKK